MQQVTDSFEADFDAVFREQVGKLAPVEKRLLSVENMKCSVVPIAFVSREERDRREIEAQRKSFIEDRVDAMLKDRDHVGQFLMELLAGPLAEHAFVAVRDAIEQEGKCWDGISSLNDMIHSAARVAAAEEWPAELLKSAPLCCECHHSDKQHDPFGTGDSPTQYECKVGDCLWGKQP